MPEIPDQEGWMMWIKNECYEYYKEIKVLTWQAYLRVTQLGV